MVWIVEWTQPGQSSLRISVYDSEEYALVAACGAVMTYIRNDWDLSDSECEAHALKVSDACATSNWKEAIRLYNDREYDGDFEMMQHFAVYERKPVAQLPTIHLLRPAHAITAPAPITKASPFKATKPGATCRGPCKQTSTDAYADKSDGTYCCYQCKLMSQAFGKPVP